MTGVIRIRGARQHNLKNLDLDMRTGEMTVVTGPERLGQVEPGVRHAVRRRPAPLRRDLQRLRAPVPRPHGPAGGRSRSRACRRRSRSTRPTRCARSRSTVGTMTELNDHLKLLFARAGRAVRQARPRCRCGTTRRRRSTPSCWQRAAQAGDPRLVVTFPVELPASTTRRGSRAVAGGQRLHARAGRARGRHADRAAQGARRGGRPLPHRRAPRRRARSRRSRWRSSAAAGASTSTCDAPRQSRARAVALLHRPALPRQRHPLRRPACRRCSRSTRPYGACETCRGFGRVIGVDYGLVIPDTQDAARRRHQDRCRRRPGQECQDDLMQVRRRRPASRATRAWTSSPRSSATG